MLNETPRKLPSAKSKPKKWRREQSDHDAALLFGQRLKSLRTGHGLSLVELAKKTGVTAATLSRIENSKMAPTYAVLLKVMEHFNLDWSQLVPAFQGDTIGEPQLLVTSLDGREFTVNLKTARRTYPLGQDSNEVLHPVVTEISPTRPANFELFAHAGVEYCYVLSGTLCFHALDRQPVNLSQGESLVFDSRIPHAYTSAGAQSVRILIVSTMPRSFPAPRNNRR